MNNKIKLPTNRSFGVVFFLFFLIIALWPILNNSEIRIWSLVIGAIFLLLGLIKSKILTPLNKLWVKFGTLLGNIIAPIVMGIVFFLVVTPTSVLMKFFNKDVLKLKKDNSDSYWINRKEEITSMKNQF